MHTPIPTDRLTMPIGEAMFTQRSTRKLRPDPIPVEDLHLIMEAAVKAPNGGNNQMGRFLIVNDRAKIREFGALYKEAWWAKRWDDHQWTKPEDIPLTDKNHRSAMGLADDIKDAPCIVFAFTAPGGGANSVIPACQNLMLAAHALGIGSLPTTLHAKVMDRFHAMFDILGWMIDGEPIHPDPARWRDVLVPTYERHLHEAMPNEA